MAAREISTKEKLLGLISDIEIIARELVEKVAMAPKHEKLTDTEQDDLVQLIILKNEELKNVYKLAQEQGETEEKMIELQSEVDCKDQDILNLQRSLKESETLLSTALFQAKQKLEQITKSQAHPVNSEELIRFAHRISSTNAVAAPQNWVPGDPRRPYPTDLEMRMGFLGKLSELPLSAPPTALLEAMHTPTGMANSYPFPYSQQNSHPGMTPDHSMASGSYVHPPHFTTSVGVDPSTRNHEEVDIMSSDSSSTSSSDSQ